MDCKTKSFMTKRKAFTLIELLIVIAIIGILFIVLVSKVDFATDKAKASGVQTDFRSFQMAFDTVAKENAGFNTFGWDTGDTNANGKRDSYDEGDNGVGGGIAQNGIQDGAEVFTGHKVYAETFTKIFTLVKPGTTFETDGYDVDAIAKLETAINANLDPKLHITIGTDGKITMANGAQDPWNKEYHGWYITNAEVDKKDRGAIVMYSDGANNEFGSEHTIANGVVSISIPGNNKAGKDDYSIVSVYTYINGYGEVKNITTGFSNNQVMNVGNQTHNDGNNNMGNGGNAGDVTEPDVVLSGGLYDSNNIQLASWDVLTTTYGLDVSKNYSSSTYLTDPTSLYSVLSNNSALSTGTKLVIGSKNGDVDITQIGKYSLAGCKNVIEIIIPNSIISIGQNALQGCSNLTNLTVPFVGYSQTSSFDTHLGYWFGADRYAYHTTFVPNSLKTVTITNATKLDNNAFYGCNNITNIILNEGITTIGYGVFSECTNLTEIVIPSTITSVGNNAFNNCNKLQLVHITDLDNWLKINFSIKESNPLYYANELLLDGDPIIGSVVIPHSVTQIPYYALKNTQITSVVFHDNITSVQEGAFKGCAYLTDFDLNQGLQTIGSYVFEGCTSIIDVNIPSSVISLDSYAFKDCSGLTNIVLNEGIEKINTGAFEGCTSLVDLTVPNSTMLIGFGAFKGCTNLTSLKVPFVGQNNSTNVYIGYWFGADRYAYHTTFVPNSLKTVTITNATKLDNNAFYGCNNITNIILNEGIITIGYNAFYLCASLVEIVIPSTITSLSSNAFDQCTGLTKICFTGTIEQWNSIAKGSNWNNNVPATEIICSDGTITLK